MPYYLSVKESVKNDVLDLLATNFADGVIRCYTGTATDVDTAITDEEYVLQFTKDGGAFTPGVATNGINFAAASGGSISLDGESYEAVGYDASGELDPGDSLGSITWFRHFNNDLSDWLQGTVSTSGAIMTVTTTAIKVDGPVAITSLAYSF